MSLVWVSPHVVGSHCGGSPEVRVKFPLFFIPRFGVLGLKCPIWGYGSLG